MEIQEIFSDMYDEERIYSVLMNEDEIALFSEIQKEFSAPQKMAKKAFREAGRLKMAEKMGLKNAENYSRSVIRGLTNPSAMNNGTYVKDLGLKGMDKLNVKISRQGRNLSDHFSGAHGTTLGNAKRH